MKQLLFMIFSLAIMTAGAASDDTKKLYKWVDDNGNVHYSDEPHKGAQEIEMKQVPAIKMVSPKTAPVKLLGKKRGSDSDTGESNNSYTTLTLSQPEKDGVVRNNASMVTLVANLEPPLSDSHSIRFFLDGEPVSKDPKALTVKLEEVEYGEHSANFVVLDQAGKQVQASETHRFQLLHMINPKLRNNRSN